MGTILIFLYIYSVASALACLFKKRLEMTLAPSIFLSILVLYLSGLATGNLMYGVYLCITAAVVCFVYAVVYGVRHKATFKELCLTPGVLVYALLFIWIWFINRGRLFSNWDEFSHWGLVVKNMDFFNAFGNYKESTVTFSGYPPATALWQYFVGKLYGYFNEGHVYCAMGWFIMSIPIFVIRNIKWHDIFKAIFIVTCMICLPFMFSKIYVYIINLQVDTVLGILVAYVLLFTFYYDDCYDSFFYLTLFVSLSVLCLVKATGVFFAIVDMCIIVASYYHTITKNKLTVLSRIFASGLGGIFLGKCSWHFYLKMSETKEAWDTNSVTFFNFWKLLTGNGEQYQYITIKNFIRALLQKDFISNIPGMTYVYWCCIFLALSIIIYKYYPYLHKIKLKYYLCGIWIGLILYTAGLLILYIFTYTEYEATNLASFIRYLMTYFIIIVYFLIGTLLESYILNKPSKSIIYISLIGMLILFVPIHHILIVTLYYNRDIQQSILKRHRYDNVCQRFQNLNYINDIVYIISQNDTGGDYWQIKYLITPIKTAPMVSMYGWSLGKPYYDGDIWTADCTEDEWIDTLIKGRCEYVYLHKVDDKFRIRYGNVFADGEEIKSPALYKLTFLDNSERKLVQIVRNE